MPDHPMIYEAMDHLTLTVWALIGDGQLASVALDGQLGTSDGKGNFHWALGPARPLKPKTFTVDATIQDVNPKTNRASLTFVLYQVDPQLVDVATNRRNAEFFPSRVFDLPENGAQSVHTLLRII